jgi:hypothetical protein
MPLHALVRRFLFIRGSGVLDPRAASRLTPAAHLS